MKKFLGILAIAGTLVACNNSADTEKATKDSLDSVAKAQKEMVTDTANAMKNAIDSNTKAQKDSVTAKDTSSHK